MCWSSESRRDDRSGLIRHEDGTGAMDVVGDPGGTRNAAKIRKVSGELFEGDSGPELKTAGRLVALALGSVILLTPFLPTVTLLMVASAIAIVALIRCGPGPSWSPLDRTLVAAFGSAMLVAAVFGDANERRGFDMLTFLIVVPVFWVLGRRCADGPWRTTARMVVVLVAAASIIGVVEVQLGSYLFEGQGLLEAPSRSGLLRARAIFPHPLVLAMFGCIALVIAQSRAVLKSVPLRTAATLVLLAGVASTNSRAGLAVALLTLAAAPVLRRLYGRKNSRVWIVLVAAVAVTLVVGLLGGYFQSSGTLVTSADADAASAQYRAELTRQLFSLIAANPLGTGFGAIAPGTVLFESSFGVIDAARTVDSEFALAAIRFGLPGLWTWMVIGSIQVRQLIRGASTSDGIVMVIVLFAAVLALHVWPVVLPFLAFFLGRQSRVQVRSSS